METEISSFNLALLQAPKLASISTNLNLMVLFSLGCAKETFPRVPIWDLLAIPGRSEVTGTMEVMGKDLGKN